MALGPKIFMKMGILRFSRYFSSVVLPRPWDVVRVNAFVSEFIDFDAYHSALLGLTIDVMRNTRRNPA